MENARSVSAPDKPSTQAAPKEILTSEKCEAAWNANANSARLKHDSGYSLFRTEFNDAFRRLKLKHGDLSDADILAAMHRDVLGERDGWRRQFIGKRGPRYDGCRLSNFECSTETQRSAVDSLLDYGRNLEQRISDGCGIILFGPKGTGKDHLLAAMANGAIMGHGVDVEWINGMDLFGMIRDTFSDDSKEDESDVLARFIRCQVLYLSDPLPPSGSLTDFQASTLFRVLDARYSSMRPTWVSVNVTSAAELDSRLGAQNGDRLRDGAVAIFCNWSSYRKVQQ
jgi:DNA replication protein DnaC